MAFVSKSLPSLRSFDEVYDVIARLRRDLICCCFCKRKFTTSPYARSISDFLDCTATKLPTGPIN